MKTVINIKTDPETKSQAQEIAKKLGLPLSVIINAYLNQFIRNRYVYFSMEPTMTEELEDLLEVVEDDLKKGKNLSKPISSVAENTRYLNYL